MALPLIERERLFGGNWKHPGQRGQVYNRAWFKTDPAVCQRAVQRPRGLILRPRPAS